MKNQMHVTATRHFQRSSRPTCPSHQSVDLLWIPITAVTRHVRRQPYRDTEPMASLFTKLINGEIPAERIYETDHELAFLDINPKSRGHTLVVPKLEVASFHELPPDAACSLVVTLQKVAAGIVRAMGTTHYNVVLNNGAIAGQIVFHVHFHIIPRYEEADRSRGRGLGDSETLGTVGEEIRRALEHLKAG